MLVPKTLTVILLVAVLVLTACSSEMATSEPKMEDSPVVMEETPSVEESMGDKQEKGDGDSMDEKPEMTLTETVMDDSETPVMTKNTPTAAPEEIEPTKDIQAKNPQVESMKEEMVGTPGFFDYEFTDARSGKPFKISDFRGKVILIETMAQWCSKCMQQQNQVYDLHQKLGPQDNFVSIGIDIDPNEDLGMLTRYVKDNGFTWLYGIAPVEVSREIANLLGDQYLNPPSTPMFIVDSEGNIHELRFGIKSADELLEELQPYIQ